MPTISSISSPHHTGSVQAVTASSNSQLAANVTQVQNSTTTPALVQRSVQHGALAFRNDYRREVTESLLDDKQPENAGANKLLLDAYQQGSKFQKKSLENDSLAIYMLRSKLEGNQDADGLKKLDKLVDDWKKAILIGTEKQSNFTSPGVTNVNKKDRCQENYYKAVDAIGRFAGDRFSCNELEDVIVSDTQAACKAFAKRHNIDLTSNDFLDMPAFLAEKAMRQTFKNNNTTASEGVRLMRLLAFNADSRLNYPAYMRGIHGPEKTTTPPAAQTPPPVPPRSPKTPTPATPPADPANIGGPDAPNTTPPVITLSNIGNPTVTIDNGPLLELIRTLTERLANGNQSITNNVYHIYQCCHGVHGSNAPYPGAGQPMQSITFPANDVTPAPEPEPQAITLTPEPTPEPETQVITLTPEPAPEPETQVITLTPEPAPEPENQVITLTPEPTPEPEAQVITLTPDPQPTLWRSTLNITLPHNDPSARPVQNAVEYIPLTAPVENEVKNTSYRNSVSLTLSFDKPSTTSSPAADESQEVEASPKRRWGYSPYLDENGNIKDPVILTVDGLHMDMRK